jgi:phosphatidylglycerophosphatase C
MRYIAFFDFDGTITTKDTLLELIKFQKGQYAFYKGMFLLSPFIIGMKCKIFRNEVVKEKVVSYFFGGMPVAEFQTQCDAFVEKEFPRLIRPKAISHIQQLRESGTDVVIVTASFSHWIKKWALKNGFKLISSELELKDGKLTGRIAGKNCRADEKVKEIKKAFDLSSYDDISCYGDTADDLPMLALATNQFFKPFRG